MSAGPVPRPDLLRILVRSLVACVLVEVVVVLGLLALGRVLQPLVWAYALGAGLGAGVALAVAEAALWRFGLPAALLAGLLLSPLAALGGGFELAFVQTWSSRAATEALLAAAPRTDPGALLGLALGALLIYGPLLVALRRGASPAGQALAMAAGAAVWAVGAMGVPLWTVPGQLTLRELPLALFAPALVVPPARRLGDRLLRLVRRRAAAPRPRPARGRRRVALVLGLGVLALAVLRARHAPPLHVSAARENVALWLTRDPETMVRAVDQDVVRRLEELSEARERAWRSRWGWSAAAPPPPPAGVVLRAPETLAHGLEVVLALTDAAAPAPFVDPFDARPIWEDAATWYRVAGARGSLTAIRRLAGLEEPPDGSWHYFMPGPSLSPEEAEEWLREGVARGDSLCRATLGLRLTESSRPSLSHYGPPAPGPLTAEEERRVTEGFALLREVLAREPERGAWHLMRALRLAPSATVEQALGRLDEGEGLFVRVSPDRPGGELEALRRARAALLEWAGRGR